MQPLTSINIAANRRRSVMAGPILPAFSKLSQVLHQSRASATGCDPPMDNAVFRLSYRLTARMMLLFAFISATQALVGEQIECTTDAGVPRAVMNAYCLVSATYSLLPQYQPVQSASNNNARSGRAWSESARVLGLGNPKSGTPESEEVTTVRRHVFYQWVPFVLALQALMFYAPHAVWKQRSGPVMRHCFAFQLDQPDATLHGSSTKLISFAGYLATRMGRLNQHLFKVFFMCELLCLVNVLVNVFLLNAYIGGGLPAFCFQQMTELFSGADENPGAASAIFPNIAKCSFGRYGVSGTLEHIDALCVLPHNVFYRRMFTVLWLWLVALSIANLLHCAYRLASILVPKVRRSLLFCLLLDDFLEYGRLVFEQCTVYDWFLLCSIGQRMDTLAFSELIRHLATGSGQALLLPSPPAVGSRRASQWSERRPTDRQTSMLVENVNKLTHV